MKYSIEEAKELVIRGGKILAESGLIARTWGNISARISDDKFVITPSGLAYETLTPGQIVEVNIADCSYEGDIKPSSEKGIHADTYRLRPDVNYIIHTHQQMASVLSIEGKDIVPVNDEYKQILGDIVPCAAYGMSSTGKLRKNVVKALSSNPRCKAVLMKYHGTICMGEDLDNSFEIAQTLEKMSKDIYERSCGKNKSGKNIKSAVQIRDYGSSCREGNKFILQCNGKSSEYLIEKLPEAAPEAAVLHAEIYKSCDALYIIHSTDDEIVEVSSTGRELRPFMDDLVQIVGVNIRTVKDALLNTRAIAKELKKKNAVLIENEGALCTGKTESDAKAAAMILRKGCAADLYAASINKTDYLSTMDAHIQRFVYKNKYSKMKEQRG